VAKCTIYGKEFSRSALDYTHPLKTKKHNIGTKYVPKMVVIRNYWNQEIVAQVPDLLKEYEDMLPMIFLEMKGIVGSLEEMNIKLK